jgi:hypothetical protein
MKNYKYIKWYYNESDFSIYKIISPESCKIVYSTDNDTSCDIQSLKLINMHFNSDFGDQYLTDEEFEKLMIELL